MARGKRIVYLTEHPAAALVESLVNFEGIPELLPDSFQLMRVEAPDDFSAEAVDAGILSDVWRENPRETQAIGDAWLTSGRTVVLAVPSAPSPETVNFVLNPLHGEAHAFLRVWRRRVEYDRRLFRVRG